MVVNHHSRHKADLIAILVDLSIFYLLFKLFDDFGAAQFTSFLFSAIIYHFFKHRVAQTLPKYKPKLSYFKTGIWITLAVLFLRCGLMAWLTLQLHLMPNIAIIIAAVLADLVHAKATAVFLYNPRGVVDQNSKNDWQIFVKIFIGYGLLLKFFYLGLPEILHEEGYYWNYGQHLAWGYLDHPPMVGWMIRLFTFPLGDSEFAVRLGPFLLWFIGAFFVYKLTKKIFDGDAALNSLFLYTLLPYFFGVSFVALPDSFLVVCWAAALYFFYRFIIEENRAAFIGIGFFIGVGLLSKYTIVLLGAAALLFLAIDRKGRVWLRRPQVYLSIAIAIVLFFPVIFWNANHQWASFSFQGPRRVTGDFNFNLFHLIGSILVLITPIGLLAAWAVASNARSLYQKRSPNDLSRTYKLFMLLTGLPLSVFLFFSLFRQTKLIWTGPIWLALLPFLSKLMSPEALRFKNWMPVYGYRPWKNTAIGLILIYGAAFNYLVLGFPGLSYPPNLLGLGWRELSAQIEAKVNAIQKITGQRPLVVGMDSDRINSWLAFYRGRYCPLSVGRHTNVGAYETGGRHLFGKESNMYLYWFPSKEQEDKTMIIVGRNPADLTGPHIENRIRDEYPIHKIEIKRRGLLILRKYYRIVEGYHRF